MTFIKNKNNYLTLVLEKNYKIYHIGLKASLQKSTKFRSSENYAQKSP